MAYQCPKFSTFLHRLASHCLGPMAQCAYDFLGQLEILLHDCNPLAVVTAQVRGLEAVDQIILRDLMENIHGACGDTYVLVISSHLTYQPVNGRLRREQTSVLLICLVLSVDQESAPRAFFRNLGSAATIASTRLLESQLGDLYAVLSRWHYIVVELATLSSSVDKSHTKGRYTYIFTDGECNTTEGFLSPVRRRLFLEERGAEPITVLRRRVQYLYTQQSSTVMPTMPVPHLTCRVLLQQVFLLWLWKRPRFTWVLKWVSLVASELDQVTPPPKKKCRGGGEYHPLSLRPPPRLFVSTASSGEGNRSSKCDEHW